MRPAILYSIESVYDKELIWGALSPDVLVIATPLYVVSHHKIYGLSFNSPDELLILTLELKWKFSYQMGWCTQNYNENLSGRSLTRCTGDSENLL